MWPRLTVLAMGWAMGWAHSLGWCQEVLEERGEGSSLRHDSNRFVDGRSEPPLAPLVHMEYVEQGLAGRAAREVHQALEGLGQRGAPSSSCGGG